jgi:hypothetical protein
MKFLLMLCLLLPRQSTAFNLGIIGFRSRPSPLLLRGGNVFRIRQLGTSSPRVVVMDHEDARQRQRRRRRGPGGRRGCEIEEEERAAPITGDPGSLERLCTVTVRACQLMRPLISAIYDELGQPSTSSDLGGGLLPSDEGGASSSSSSAAAAAVVVVQKAKEDGSAFTIADGLVQRLLVDELFSRVPFRDVVGEEEEDEGAGGGGDGDSRGGAAVDARDCDERSWSRVNGLTVPMHLRSMVESTRSSVGSLAEESLLAQRGGGGASSS